MMPTDFVDERLDRMLERPKNWGAAEAFELQVLLLLEVRRNLEGGPGGQASLIAIHDDYAAFLKAQFPELGPRPLCSITPDVEVIADALKGFRASLTTREAKALPGGIPLAPESLGIDVDVRERIATMPRAA